MNKIKFMIIIAFVATLVVAAVGVAVYYSSLAPFRLAAQSGDLEGILSHVSYLEYNATDQAGANYLVKLWNNPVQLSGKAELYVDGSLAYTFYYNYTGNGLTYARIEYPNGTLIEYSGADVVLIEDYFLTSLEFSYDAQNATVTVFKPFPGVGPVYLQKFLADRSLVNWSNIGVVSQSSSISQLMSLRVGTGSVNVMNETLGAGIVSLTPNVANPPTQWAQLAYSLILVDYHGYPLIPTWSVSITAPGNVYRVTYNIMRVGVQLT